MLNKKQPTDYEKYLEPGDRLLLGFCLLIIAITILGAIAELLINAWEKTP